MYLDIGDCKSKAMEFSQLGMNNYESMIMNSEGNQKVPCIHWKAAKNGQLSNRWKNNELKVSALHNDP